MIEKIQAFLSGGPTNSNPDLSLGGTQSSVKLLSETPSYAGGSISGVALIDAAGNSVGAGTLEYIAAGQKLRWTKPGGAAATITEEVAVGAGGTFVLICKELDAFLTVTVTAASLPGANASASVAIAIVALNLFAAITAAQSLSGYIAHRCVYLKNVTAASVTVKLWVMSDLTSPAILSIGSRYTTGGNTENAISTETNAPASVTFGNHNALANALTVTLAAGQSIGLWLRRVVDPLTSQGANPDSAVIAMEIT